MWDNSGYHIFGLRIYLSVVPSGEHVLTEQDHNNICAFKLQMVSNMLRMVFNQLQFTCQHEPDISSYWVNLHSPCDSLQN